MWDPYRCVAHPSTSSTPGGALFHQYGAGARATCSRAFTGTDKVARLTRPQCRLAGLNPARLALSH